jgi:hypothetical protein
MSITVFTRASYCEQSNRHLCSQYEALVNTVMDIRARLFWNTNVKYCVHKSLILDFI